MSIERAHTWRFSCDAPACDVWAEYSSDDEPGARQAKRKARADGWQLGTHGRSLCPACALTARSLTVAQLIGVNR